MMANNTVDAQESFIIPSCTLRGSRQEMVQDIDQAIVGLLALRHLIGAGGSPQPALALEHGGRSALRRMREWLSGLPLKLNGRLDHVGSPEAP